MTTYYVATTGNDNNDGSFGTPWLTIRKACNTAVDDDVILVADGTYDDAAIITIRYKRLNIIGNGLNTVIRCQFKIAGSSHIEFSDLLLNGFTHDTAADGQIEVYDAVVGFTDLSANYTSGNKPFIYAAFSSVVLFRAIDTTVSINYNSVSVFSNGLACINIFYGSTLYGAGWEIDDTNTYRLLEVKTQAPKAIYISQSEMFWEHGNITATTSSGGIAVLGARCSDICLFDRCQIRGKQGIYLNNGSEAYVDPTVSFPGIIKAQQKIAKSGSRFKIT